MTSDLPDVVKICPEDGSQCTADCRVSGSGSHGLIPCVGGYGPHANNAKPVPDEPTLPMDLPENPKAIYGRAKPSLGLIPGAAMIEEADVFALGAEKYGPYNWRKNPVESMTYVNAMLRHLYSWLDGEDADPESGRSHLAHARACLGILLDAKACNTLIDDRPHGGVSSALIAERTQSINP